MSLCSQCGAQFSCAMKDADAGAGADAGADAASAQPCWCTYLPAALPVPTAPGAGCWCPACLTAHIAAAATTATTATTTATNQSS